MRLAVAVALSGSGRGIMVVVGPGAVWRAAGARAWLSRDRGQHRPGVRPGPRGRGQRKTSTVALSIKCGLNPNLSWDIKISHGPAPCAANPLTLSPAKV